MNKTSEYEVLSKLSNNMLHQTKRMQKLTANDRSLSSPAKPMSNFMKLGSMKSISDQSYRGSSGRRVTDGGQISGLLLHSHTRRRESFLYRSDSDMETSTNRSSRNQSLTGDEHSIGHSDEIIITPFAQVLSSLKKIRVNFMLLTNINSVNNKKTEPNQVLDKDDIMKNVSLETLEELEWCLSQLEALQTSRSVSNLASVKFKRILSKELHIGDESNSTNKQISDYIFKTFLEEKDSLPISGRSQLFETKYSTVNLSGVLHQDLYTSMTHQQTIVIEKYLENHVNEWHLDVFLLNEITNNRPLQFLAYHTFKINDLFTKFQMDAKQFICTMKLLEDAYNHNTPYHNNIHAADVTHTTCVLLNSTALKDVFSNFEIFALLLASIIHDIDHPGVTNQFLINTNDKLALVYNDMSILENHHLAVAFKLFHSDPNNCIFDSFDKKEIQNIRRLMIDMVLATDMSKHMSLLADLKTLVETKKVSGSSIIGMENYTERIQVLQIMIHCSDLSNPTKTLVLYEKWVHRIMEEFYRQGDRERDIGLEISPMCDREESNVAMSQVRFIDYIVHPLWETWADLVYPDCQFILDELERNRNHYHQQLT